MKAKQLFPLLLGAMSALGFTACSDDTEDTTPVDVLNPAITNRWSGTSAELWNVNNQYVNQMVIPTYTALAAASEELYEKSLTIQQHHKSGALTDADIEAACHAFEQARYYWERSEAFLYGAASDFNIDPHIDSWPLDQEQMTQFFASPAMIAGLNSADPIAFVSSHNAEFDTALGFHGIEYILYRDGKARPASAFTSSGTAGNGGASASAAGGDEIAFLAAVSGDLRDHCYQLEVSWMGEAAPAAHRTRVAALGMTTRAMGDHGYYYGADLLLAGYSNSDPRYHATTYASPAAVAANILVGGCSNICAEVADQKMGQAWRVLNGNGTDEDAGDYIESPYSKHSFIDYQGNIYSIQGSLYGALDASTPAKHSIMTFLKENNYPAAASLESALASAIAALQTCINSGVAFVDDPGNPRVKAAIDAVTKLDEELNKAAQWIEKL